MKKITVILMLAITFQVSAQSDEGLFKHYEAYYKQMQLQGDVQGVISALTHLNVISPSQSRVDTLAVLYMNGGKHLQALKTIGIEKNTSDSDMAVEVKAVCLKELNEPKRALEHFEVLFLRNPNVLIAYELADLKIQLKDFVGANANIEYGINNATDDIKKAYYERQQSYQVPIKAGFIYLKGLVKYGEDQDANIDPALVLFEEALKVAPNFNLAHISIEALKARKNPPVKED